MTQIQSFSKSYLKTDLPDIRSGDIVKVHQKVKDGDKERIQVFEGVVLAAKHGTGAGGTITVRKVAEDVGVERIFPLHSPLIDKIEVVRHAKVRRAKLLYLRQARGRRAKLKARGLGIAVVAGEAGGEKVE